MTSIGFFSGSAASGSTMLAVSTSKLLVAMGKRVLHIFSGISSMYSYLEKNSAGSLDDIKSSLIGRCLTEEELRATAKTVEGMELIASNKWQILFRLIALIRYSSHLTALITLL